MEGYSQSELFRKCYDIRRYGVWLRYNYGLTITCSNWRQNIDCERSMERISQIQGTYNWTVCKEYTKKGKVHYHCHFETPTPISKMEFPYGDSFSKHARRLNEGDFIKLETLTTPKSLEKWLNYIHKEQGVTSTKMLDGRSNYCVREHGLPSGGQPPSPETGGGTTEGPALLKV